MFTLRPIWKIFRKGIPFQNLHANSLGNNPVLDTPHQLAQGPGNFFQMTKILKGLGWGRRLASFIFHTRVVLARARNIPIHCQNPGTEGLSGEISKDIKITASTAHSTLLGPMPICFRNIYYLLCCSYSSGLATCYSVHVASGLSQPEISRVALHCPITGSLPWSLQTTQLSPFLGPYGNLPSGPIGYSKGEAHASSKKKKCQNKGK